MEGKALEGLHGSKRERLAAPNSTGGGGGACVSFPTARRTGSSEGQ